MVSDLVLGIDEVWLKGGNRGRYMANLRYNIQETLRVFHNHSFRVENDGPLFWASSERAFSESALCALLKVPGVHGVELAHRVEGLTTDETGLPLAERIQIMGRRLLELTADSFPQPTTFKIDTRRSYKKFPGTSPQISGELGATLLRAYPNLQVDLHKPEHLVRVRILKKGVFVSLVQKRGVGGLPLGTSGHLLCLLSGGIDSPVASYLMAARGSRQTFVFFHAYPFVGHEVKEKVLGLVRILALYQNSGRLVVVPFGNIQNHIAETALNSYRTLFFRRYMIRCANRLASCLGAQGLIMGDSLGQVSSQTLENMSALDKDSELLILRPLVGLNKEEIIRYAERIGSFELSKAPHDDACQLFAPKHPVTKVDLGYWDTYDREHDFSEDVERAIQASEFYTVNKLGEVKQTKGLPFSQPAAKNCLTL